MTSLRGIRTTVADFPELQKAWGTLRGRCAGREALITGNGPAVSQLDPKKTERWLKEGNRALIFVNGFLSAPAFDIDGMEAYFVLQDPDCLFFLEEFAAGRTAAEVSARVRSGAYQGKVLTTSGTLDRDINGIAAALDHPGVIWCVPRSALPTLERLGIKGSIPLSRAVIPDHVPLWVRRGILRLGLAGPHRFNPVSAATVEWAVLMALELGFERVYVIGHRDVVDYRSFRASPEGWEYNYRYYWDTEDRWIRRAEPYSDWLDSWSRMIALARSYEERFPSRIRYLAHQHLFYPMTSPDRPDVFR